MAAVVTSFLQTTVARPSIYSTRRIFNGCSNADAKEVPWNKLASTRHVSSVRHLHRSFTSASPTFGKAVTKAKLESDESKPVTGLPINLKG